MNRRAGIPPLGVGWAGILVPAVSAACSQPQRFVRLFQARRSATNARKAQCLPRLTCFLQPQEAKGAAARPAVPWAFRRAQQRPEPRSPRRRPRIPQRPEGNTERRGAQSRRFGDVSRRRVQAGGRLVPPPHALKLQNLPKTNETRARTGAHGAFRSPRGQDKNDAPPTAPRASERNVHTPRRAERRLVLTRREAPMRGARRTPRCLGRLAPEPLLALSQKLHGYFIRGVPVKIGQSPATFPRRVSAGIAIYQITFW